MGRRISLIVSALLFVSIAMATVMNVFVDAPDAESVARKAACNNKIDCKATLSSLHRNPLGRGFLFESHSATIEVWCQRPYIVYGDYQCVNASQTPSSASAKPSSN